MANWDKYAWAIVASLVLKFSVNASRERKLYRIYVVVKIRRVEPDYAGETEEVAVAPSEQRTGRSSSD